MTTDSWPTSPNFAGAQFGMMSNSQSFASPFTGTVQTTSLQGDYWHGTLSLPPMTYTQAGEWCAFLARQRGNAGRFYGYDPAQSTRGNRGILGAGVSAITGNTPLYPSATLYPSGTLYPAAENFAAWNPTADLTLGAGASVGDQYVYVTGFPAWDYSSLGVNPDVESGYWFKAGDYISVDSELKMVTQDVPYTTNSLVRVPITPPIRTDRNAGGIVLHETARGVFMLADNQQAMWDVNTAVHYGITFSIREALT